MISKQSDRSRWSVGSWDRCRHFIVRESFENRPVCSTTMEQDIVQHQASFECQLWIWCILQCQLHGSSLESACEIIDQVVSHIFLILFSQCHIFNYSSTIGYLRMTARSNKTSPRSADKTARLFRCKFIANSVVGKSNLNRSAELWNWLALVTQASKFLMKILQFFNLKFLFC